MGCVQIPGEKESHPLEEQAVPYMPWVSITLWAEPKSENHFSPGTVTANSSSYLFHLTSEPVDATPLSFGDSGVSHLVDGDGRARCARMDRSHWRGNTHGS